MDKRGIRVGRNGVVFREVNERLRELGEGFSLVSEAADFICECANQTCVERITMTLNEYEDVRADPKRFFVIKGHELPEFEKVVSETDSYIVVEKLPGGPAGIAIRDDPRR